MFAHPSSRSASRSTSLTAGLPPRRPPASIAPQAVETNVPSAVTGGPLSGLGRIARKLRVVDAGTGNFLYSRIRQDADVPHGLRQPAFDSLRRPDADAVPPRKLIRRRKRAVQAVAGGAPKRSAPVDDTAVNRADATALLRTLFSPAAAAGDERDLDKLLRRLMRLAVPGLMPYERPVLLATVLARLASGDPVAAAGLLKALANAEPKGAAFVAQRALAGSGGPGIECLLAFDRHIRLSDDPGLAPIQREAYAARIQVAGLLGDSLPSESRPDSLAGCIALARSLAQPVAAGSAPEVGSLRTGRELLIDGLLCAQALVDDPETDAPARQREAYLAVRNGIFTAEDLATAQARLFKINTYIDRASRRGAGRFGDAVLRLFGYRKSPLHALTQLGTAQSKTRHPADDVAVRCTAMDGFVARLNDSLAGLPAEQRTSDLAMRMSIRAAIARHWKRHIVDHGWQDTLPIDSRMRRAIARDVAQQLGVDAAAVEKHAELRGAGPLQAALLDRWARQEAFDYATPVVSGDTRSFATAMSSFLQLHNGGDTILRRPTRAQTRELLHDAIEGTRQTYSVNFLQNNTMGVNASVVDILALTPAIFGAGPVAVATGSRGAYLQVGSNVHGGQLHAGSQRGGHAEAGVAGFVGKKLGEVVNLGLTGTLTPLVLDLTDTHATVVRTRMNVHGSTDGDAWRRLLLDVYDAITWKDGEAGPPQDAAQMWQQLAQRFYRNPNLSIDDMRSRQTSAGGSAALSVGARVGVIGGVQVGPNAALGGSMTYQNRLRQRDAGANRVTALAANNASRGGTASGGLTGAAPGITGGTLHDNAGHPGATQSLAMPSAGLGSKSVSFLRNTSGVTMRIVTDQGRVDADYSVMDTETGSAASFARYIDSQRDEWLAAMGGDDAARRDLDVFLTRLQAEETRGNVTYGERRRLTPMAALKIDYFRARAAAVADPGRVGDERIGREIERLEGEVGRVLNDPLSWDPRSMWVLEMNQNVSTKGPTVIAQLVSRKLVSAPRQRDVLIARRMPHREQLDEAVF